MNKTKTALLAILMVSGLLAIADGPSSGQTWHYRLLGDSSVTMTVDTGGSPIIVRTAPLRGGFDLVGGPTFSPDGGAFTLTNILFSTLTDDPALTNSFIGTGTFGRAGAVVQFQDMDLQLQMSDGRPLNLTNLNQTVTRSWPIAEIKVIGKLSTPQGGNFSILTGFTFRLLAAPVRDLWFSTDLPFTSVTPVSWQVMSAGDIVSVDGHVVKKGGGLLQSVGLVSPGGGDSGANVFGIAPGGGILFSLTGNAENGTLGQVQAGDILTYQGAVFQHNQDLMGAFVLPEVPPTDHGLDGLQILDNGEFLYSITNDTWSVALNIPVRRGDLLSSRGQIARSNESLLSLFHPTNAPSDLGLKAFYVWPGGEVWFSVEQDFGDASLGQIQSGDLLSDQGFIVYRNQELLAAFTTANTTENFGLRGIHVVTDVAAPAPQPSITGYFITPEGDLALSWQGGGRVFEIEQASTLTGPYGPSSVILPGGTGTVSLTNPPPAEAYFRVRQW